MLTMQQYWDVERAAAWLRHDEWDDAGAAAQAASTLPATAHGGEPALPCWPALVAPLYGPVLRAN
jgi:sugar/nucleoside kinase (ribokinase family)